MTEIVTVTSRLHGERTFHLVEMQPYRRMDGTETTVRGWQATLLPESTLSAIMSAPASCGHSVANAYRRYVPLGDLSRCSKAALIRSPRRRAREASEGYRGRAPWRPLC